MTVKRTAIILTAVLILSGLAAAQGKIIESLWTVDPVKIDGVAAEWDDAMPITEKVSKVDYALKNDGKNIYIIMVFRDMLSRTTLEYTGMKIYFTTGTKKSKDFGIHFQKKQISADQLISNLETLRGQPLGEAEKAELRKKKTHIIFTEDLIQPKKSTIQIDPKAVGGAPGFQSIEKGKLAVYEFRIPLGLIHQMGGTGAGPGNPIKLGFEWGGMTNQIMKDMMAGRADQSVSAGDRGVRQDSGFTLSEGAGDGGGGEISGMGGFTGDMRRNPMYKFHSFWIDAKLASPGD